MCPNANRPTELKWFGFAIDGGAFYAFDCPPLESNPKHDNMAYVLAEATEEAINEGLKKLIDETWDFQVRKVADSEFAVLFPNADSLRLCKNATNLTLPVSKITVVVSEVRPAPKPSGRLQEVWVRLHDVPPPLLSSANLMAAMVMLGKPLIVDELSLSKDEPVLMKFHTPVPAKLRTTVNLSVHGEIFPIRVVPEPSKGSVSATDLPPPPHNDKDDQDDDEEEETEELSASDHNWKRQKAKSGDKSAAPSSNATSAGTKKTSLQIVTTAALQTVKKIRKKSGVKPSPALKAGTSKCQAPLECPSPRSPVAKTLMPNSFDQYGSNLVLLQSPPDCSPVGSLSFPQLSAPLSGNTPSSVIISSPEASSPALHLSPLKAAKLSAADREEVGWQSPIHWEFDNETLAVRCQKLKKKKELSQGSAPAQRKGFINLLAEISASAPASKAPRSVAVPSTPLAPVSASKSASIHSKTASSAGGLPATTPTSGSRRSTRAGGQTGEPVLQKAIRRAVEKETPGTSKIPATPAAPLPSSVFAVLPAASDSHLLSVAADCNILLGSSGDNPLENLELIRSKELAQAALAEALAKAVAVKDLKDKEQNAKEVNNANPPRAPVGNAPAMLSTKPGGQSDSASDEDHLTINQLVVQAKLTNNNVKRTLRCTPARQARALKECPQ
jgi:hypothetical protein